MVPVEDYDSDESLDIAELQEQFREWESDRDIDWSEDWQDLDLDDLTYHDIDWDELSEAFDYEDDFDWFSKLS